MTEPMPPAAIFQADVWGDLAAFEGRFAGAFGAPPPGPGRAHDLGGGRRALWIQPRGWLVRGAPDERETLLAALRAAAGEEGAITDVSGGSTRLRIVGPDWRERLSPGGVVDLWRDDVQPGWCAGTVVEHIAVRLDVVDLQAVDIYVAPSYAPHLRRLWNAETGN